MLSAERVYPFDADAHNALVASYYRDAGLPRDQIADITVSALMTDWRMVTSEQRYTQSLGYVTTLHRMFDGVPVANSFAWARFGKGGVVLDEMVWWPELPGSIRQDLAAFRKTLSNGSAFQDKLPIDAKGLAGRLVVHHALPMGEKWYQRVTWDVVVGKVCRTFDVSGAEIKMVGWSDEWKPPVSDQR